MKKLTFLLVSLLIGIVILAMSTFTVDQREYAVVFRLGEIISIKKEPGLYFKTPLVENVQFFDNRILTLNWQEPDRFITSEKKNVLVDSFIKWKIVDPAKYYVSVKGDEVQAERRISQAVNDGLRAEFGKRTIHDVVSGERGEIMQILTERADRDLRSMGIQILDVRLRRVDLPKEVSESFINVWKLNGNQSQMNCAHKVLLLQKKFVLMLKNNVMSSLPKLIKMHKR